MAGASGWCKWLVQVSAQAASPVGACEDVRLLVIGAGMQNFVTAGLSRRVFRYSKYQLSRPLRPSNTTPSHSADQQIVSTTSTKFRICNFASLLSVPISALVRPVTATRSLSCPLRQSDKRLCSATTSHPPLFHCRNRHTDTYSHSAWSSHPLCRFSRP